MDHEDADGFALRVDEAERAVASAVAEGARRHQEFAVGLHDIPAESPARAGLAGFEIARVDGGHLLHRVFREQAQPVVFAAVQKELIEAEEIAGGGIQAAFRERILGTFAELHLALAQRVGGVLERFAIFQNVGGGHPAPLLFGWIGVGVDHAERLEDFGFEKLLVRHAADHFDDARDCGDASVGIGPFGSWLKEDGLLRIDENNVREGFVQCSVEFADCRGRVENDSRGVGHEVADCDLAIQLLQGHSLVVFEFDCPLQTSEFGEMDFHGIVDVEPALFGKHHRRHTDDGLGHRVQLEDVVRLHRLRFGFDVGEADGVMMKDLAVLCDEGDESGGGSLVDELFEA